MPWKLRAYQSPHRRRWVPCLRQNFDAIHPLRRSMRSSEALRHPDTLLRKAKAPFYTAETAPHYLILTDEALYSMDADFRMNPPLRTEADRQALIEALKDGTIEIIATDHAPHAAEEKNCSMTKAAFGIVGLETMASLTYTELVEPGILTPMQMAEKTSYNPAKILGLDDKGAIAEGKIADVVVFDPTVEYVIDKNTFYSKGKNTPFHGRKVKGDIRYTLVEGNVVYER